MTTEDLANHLHLTRIWENSTWGAGHIGDAIHALKNDPKADIHKHLGEALILLSKATAEIQQHLATRD